MTFADLKERILNTGYLPLWLKEGIVKTPPITMKPLMEEANPDAKWCPFGRSALTMINEDGSQRPSKGTPHNRVTYLKADDAGVVQLHAVSLRSSLCIQHRCAVWDEAHQSCGLRNPIIHATDVVQAARDLVAMTDARYGVEDTTTTGDETP